MHDHRELARHRDRCLAVTPPSGQRVPQVLSLSSPRKRVISADAASYSARRTSASPAFEMRSCTSIDVPDCQRCEASPK